MSVSTAVKTKKAEIVKKIGKTATNTGSTDVQIALLTTRIQELNQHFKKFPKDHHSNRGLLKMVGQRKRLLNYLRTTDAGRYTSLINTLGLRK
jgi:small subunit ribosomal protein S15